MFTKIPPEEEIYLPTKETVKDSFIKPEQFFKLYEQSIKQPEKFWSQVAMEEINWFQKWDKVFVENDLHYKWFVKGKINITFNCLDRHINKGLGEKIAYIYLNEAEEEIKISYKSLLEKVNQLGNSLLNLGIKKGDTITIYMPLTIELIISMLACARIGAIHSVVYGGFSKEALKTRIEDTNSKFIITSSFTKRRGKKIPLFDVVDAAQNELDFKIKIILHNRTSEKVTAADVIDFYTLLNRGSKELEPEHNDSEDPLFILYTSGSTGKPKGILHTVGGYNLYTHYTSKVIFDLKDDDIYWCTADCGWITGHSYVVYGPLSNGITSILYEGAPDFPDPTSWWKIIEKYKVTKFYTAPTAIRMFMKYGEKYLENIDLSSLKIIGSVGEPLNPEAWRWYYKNIGNKKCPIVDTWWQTETGGHMISTIPSLPQKPGKVGFPFLGIDADIVDLQGNSMMPNEEGFLVIKSHWPSALRTCWNNDKRYEKYWTEIPGMYLTGDLAKKDKEGYVMILGRADDLIKVAGHGIGSAEIEHALVSNHAVAEAAAIGIPDEITGEAIKVFIILKNNALDLERGEVVDEIKKTVEINIGKFAVPRFIDFVTSLPKTRSGKIMRRVLKAKELGIDPGDISTLEE